MSTRARIATAVTVGLVLGVMITPVVLVIAWEIGDGDV